MKVLFYTNLPSPYRVDFFNLLGQSVDLTVVFTEHDSVLQSGIKNVGWVRGDENIRSFKAIFLCDHDGAQTKSKNLYPNAIHWANGEWDAIFVTNYASPTEILLIHALKQKKIPYILEVDGGFVREENALKRQLKKHLISGAKQYLSTGIETDRYLEFYGAESTKLRRYPLSSVFACEVADSPANVEEKSAHRDSLGLPPGFLCLFAGQLIHRKGVDILIESARRLPHINFCVVGNGDHLLYNAPGNVIFPGQKNRADLAKYYRAADLFVLPTREDIWGLVIGEAAAKGLPIITTNRCIAGLELLDHHFIVPSDDANALTDKIAELRADPTVLKSAAEASLSAARRYTIEEMVKIHLEFLSNL